MCEDCCEDKRSLLGRQASRLQEAGTGGSAICDEQPEGLRHFYPERMEKDRKLSKVSLDTECYWNTPSEALTMVEVNFLTFESLKLTEGFRWVESFPRLCPHLSQGTCGKSPRVSSV